MFVKSVRFINLMLSAVVTGIFTRDALSAQGLGQLSGTTYTEYRQSVDKVMAKVMPVLGGATVFSALLALLLERRTSRAAVILSTVGLVCAIVEGATTLVVEVPLNRQIFHWSSAALPADWSDKRQRWLNGNLIRTLAAFIGLACQFTSVLSRSSLVPDTKKGI